MEQRNYIRRTYSQEEDNIIIECVEESPDNIARAFRKAASMLEDRTVKAISMHYYKMIVPPNNHENKCFMTMGKKQANINRKVTREGRFATLQEPTPTPISKWRRILNIIFE